MILSNRVGVSPSGIDLFPFLLETPQLSSSVFSPPLAETHLVKSNSFLLFACAEP